MKILVAYDGTIHSKKALRYGIEKVREKGGVIMALHVFNCTMFYDYDAAPGAIDIARKESLQHVEEANRIIEEAGSGIKACIIKEEGNPEDEILKYASGQKMDVIFCPPAYKSIVKKAPCPVCMVPGNMLVPLDNSEISGTTLEKIIKEAGATGSKVLLLGVVPVHIFSSSEKHEMEKIKEETIAVLKKTANVLKRHGIEVEEIIRSGYPDEEIVKVADEFYVSMIIMTPDRDTPSELNKAASIIFDEINSSRKPVLFVEKIKAV